jgi:L,D-transpeptidase catalytic domain
MCRSSLTKHMMVGATASLLVGARFAPATGTKVGSPTTPRAEASAESVDPDSLAAKHSGAVSGKVKAAVAALAGLVRPLSHPDALEDAFQSYFAFKAKHGDEIRRPLLYFADYGLPSSTPRGYVFDMDRLRIVDGPFTVAHGRGSRESTEGIPTRFSNSFGSAATSLGLYLTQDLYRFRGQTIGGSYSAVGLRLEGVSTGYNDNARARRVVAHGAPYVTRRGAGRSEGCPAMELSRARRLLPKLANGAMVFLFAPDSAWMEHDPWIAAE